MYKFHILYKWIFFLTICQVVHRLKNTSLQAQITTNIEKFNEQSKIILIFKTLYTGLLNTVGIFIFCKWSTILFLRKDENINNNIKTFVRMNDVHCCLVAVLVVQFIDEIFFIKIEVFHTLRKCIFARIIMW